MVVGDCMRSKQNDICVDGKQLGGSVHHSALVKMLSIVQFRRPGSKDTKWDKRAQSAGQRADPHDTPQQRIIKSLQH